MPSGLGGGLGSQRGELPLMADVNVTALVDVMLVMEALGESLVVEPYWVNVGLAGRLVARGAAGSGRAGSGDVGQRADGVRRGALAGPGAPDPAAGEPRGLVGLGREDE